MRLLYKTLTAIHALGELRDDTMEGLHYHFPEKTGYIFKIYENACKSLQKTIEDMRNVDIIEISKIPLPTLIANQFEILFSIDTDTGYERGVYSDKVYDDKSEGSHKLLNIILGIPLIAMIPKVYIPLLSSMLLVKIAADFAEVSEAFEFRDLVKKMIDSKNKVTRSQEGLQACSLAAVSASLALCAIHNGNIPASFLYSVSSLLSLICIPHKSGDFSKEMSVGFFLEANSIMLSNTVPYKRVLLGFFALPYLYSLHKGISLQIQNEKSQNRS